MFIWCMPRCTSFFRAQDPKSCGKSTWKEAPRSGLCLNLQEMGLREIERSCEQKSHGSAISQRFHHLHNSFALVLGTLALTRSQFGQVV